MAFVVPLHVPIEGIGIGKGSTALGLLAHQLGRPVNRTHVIRQLLLLAKLPSTATLLTDEGFLFLMDNLDVGGQVLPLPKVF